MANGTTKITGLEMPAGYIVPDKELPEALQTILNTEDERDKKKKKKTDKKKKNAGKSEVASTEA